MSEVESEGVGGSDTPDTVDAPVKTRKKRKSSCYSLEQYQGQGEPNVSTWVEIKDGFVSPKSALLYAEKNNLEGVFRAVRVASKSFAYSLKTPKPVLTVEMVEIKAEKK